ncbi:MAG TPA: SDR family oxidoreductase [Acidimicrobiales bacterium]|nr:SDR family oxidoreductase [Acidimicrobiales bacterium]
MRDLEGRVAVVTGGGSGIGRATALALADRHVSVAIADLDAGRADAVAAEVDAQGSAGLGLRCDVTSGADLAAVRDAVLERFGRVDIVMNNVAVISLGLPTDIPFEEWQRAVAVNLLSIVASNEVFLPLLIDQGSGHVVNTASTAGLYGYDVSRLPYAATKSAVVGLSEGLALFLAPLGVGVTCLCPGPVRTNIAESVRVFGHPQLRGPALELIEPEVVGRQVVGAIEDGTFLLLTHPEVHEILVRRAEDPEGFLAGQLAHLWGDGSGAATTGTGLASD